MNSTQKTALGAVLLLALASALYFFVLKKDESTKTSDPVADSQGAGDKGSNTTPDPVRMGSDSSDSEGPSMPPAMPSYDDDPKGELRLEGQVIDADGQGVGGATVNLTSSPPREVVTEEDGSFAFDELVERSYALFARTEDSVGGPVQVNLSASSDPVIIRVAPGGGLEVEVVNSEGTGISGATVYLAQSSSTSATTDAEGIATLKNLPPGMTVIAAKADGYAEERTLANIPRGSVALTRQRLVLQSGVALSGRVIDEAGKGIEGVQIVDLEVGDLMQLRGPGSGAVTDAKGAFTLPAVPQGTVYLRAVHDSYAPATSEHIEVGNSAITDVELVMSAGGRIAGRVVDTSGNLIAHPTIRVQGKEMSGRGQSSVNRQVIGEKDGSFEMRGLPREALLVYASSDEASSQLVDVNLSAKGEVKDLEIVLDVVGTISGTVVDENGEGVPEAQVLAQPDFWKGADMDDMRMRGPAMATTAGDGSFTLKGLSGKQYSLHASLDADWRSAMGRGTDATVGESNVQVVLATPGSIVGEVQFDDGSTPALATVSVGWGNTAPATGGTFRLSGVAPGVHEVTVRGPDFADSYASKIEVKAGEESDVGTIKVKRGRSISGRVLSPEGSPVPGATVALAPQLLSDGNNLTPQGLGAAMSEQLGVRTATTNDAGEFVLKGVGEKEQTIAADHPEVGRAVGVLVPGGAESQQVQLQMVGVGSVRGTVTTNGKPSPMMQILITPAAGSAHITIVNSDAKGEFLAARVGAGEYKVSAMKQGGGSSAMAAEMVTVAPGQEATVNIDVSEGAIDLTVKVVGQSGAQIDAAQVFLFKGAVDVKTGGEINKVFLSASGGAMMSFAKPSAEGSGALVAEFKGVSAGPFSICAIPITGNMTDPAFAQKLQRNAATLKVHCRSHQVAEGPNGQSTTFESPAMDPLPEE